VVWVHIKGRNPKVLLMTQNVAHLMFIGPSRLSGGCMVLTEGARLMVGYISQTKTSDLERKFASRKQLVANPLVSRDDKYNLQNLRTISWCRSI